MLCLCFSHQSCLSVHIFLLSFCFLFTFLFLNLLRISKHIKANPDSKINTSNTCSYSPLRLSCSLCIWNLCRSGVGQLPCTPCGTVSLAHASQHHWQTVLRSLLTCPTLCSKTVSYLLSRSSAHCSLLIINIGPFLSCRFPLVLLCLSRIQLSELTEEG